MQSQWDRRRVLELASMGTLWAALPRAARARARRRDRGEDLVGTIIETPRERVFERLEPLLREGVGWQELQHAVFAAGIREIRPRPVGFKLHAVLVTESVFQLAEASSPAQAMRAVLWNVDDFKENQARDVREGDWTQPAAPRADFGDDEAAAKELAAALAGFDAERADRALVGALPRLDLDDVFELVRWRAIQDFANLGHKPIFAAHVERVLRRGRGRTTTADAESALRSVVYGMLGDEPGEAMEVFEANRGVARELGRLAGTRREPARSVELARLLAVADVGVARGAVVESLASGAHADEVWDAVRLASLELFSRQPSLLPVHPVTVSSALAYIHRETRREETRTCALLQAACWVPLFREALQRIVGLPDDARFLDADFALAPERGDGAGSAQELFEDPSADNVLAYFASAADPEPFDERLRHHLIRGVVEHHQPKFTAVLLEDAHFAHAGLRPWIFAHALEYLPSAATATTPVHARAAELVQRLRS